jgi:ABC-type antimicrobial peptide transport system permease subunit
MNGSRSAALTVAWRFASLASFRTEGFPTIPVIILGVLIFLAVFANVLAPHDPEVGNLGERFRPPFWQQGGSSAPTTSDATCSRGSSSARASRSWWASPR